MRIMIGGDVFVSADCALPDLDNEILAGCAQAVVNLEGPLGNSSDAIRKTGPNLRAHSNLPQHLARWGVTAVTLANNHILDLGTAGLRATINGCTEAGIQTVGAGFTAEESARPVVLAESSESVCLLSASEREWNHQHGIGAAILQTVTTARAVRQAASQHKCVILIVHGGNEYFDVPSPELTDKLRFFAECGASAIFMHHAHVMSGSERWMGVPIYYGLGNLLFTADSRDPRFHEGVVTYADVDDQGSVEVTLDFVCFDSGKNRLSFIRGTRHGELMDEFARLGDCIADPALHARAWSSMVRRKRRMYFQLMTPWIGSSRMAMRVRALIALTVSMRLRYSQSLWLNTIRCESHRAALQCVLEDSLGSDKSAIL